MPAILGMDANEVLVFGDDTLDLLMHFSMCPFSTSLLLNFLPHSWHGYEAVIPHSYLWCLTKVAWCRYDLPHLLHAYLFVAGSLGDSEILGFSSTRSLLESPDWSISEGKMGPSPKKTTKYNVIEYQQNNFWIQCKRYCEHQLFTKKCSIKE